MDRRDTRQLFRALESYLRESQTKLTLLHLISGEDCYPPDKRVLQMVSDCRELGIDVLHTEEGDHRLLMAGQVYDDLYAVTHIPKDVSAVTAARDLQRRMSADRFCPTEKTLVPASDASTIMKRWEWQLTLVFGPRFAARLMEKAICGQSPGRMTAEGLENVRRHLISATGGCIDFSIPVSPCRADF